jgi:DNA-binding response OmpR family regulator
VNHAPTILIAEDEAHIAHILCVWLERHNFRTIKAPNGAIALDVLRTGTEQVDAIISDANMPVVDGLAFLKAVREELQLSLPFLLLTARCDQSKLGATIAAFNAQIYPKPFMPSQFVMEIERLLQASSVKD